MGVTLGALNWLSSAIAQVEKVQSCCALAPMRRSGSSSVGLAAMAGAKPSFKGSLEMDQQAHLASVCVLTRAVRH